MVRTATPALSGYNVKTTPSLQLSGQLYAQHNLVHSTDPEGTRLNFPNELRPFDPTESGRLLPNLSTSTPTYVKVRGLDSRDRKIFT